MLERVVLRTRPPMKQMEPKINLSVHLMLEEILSSDPAPRKRSVMSENLEGGFV